ncbi:MAG: alpha/beta hydrolase [Chloroflexi bacterium]|nr:alpha/beta hydrolase [Chloroflexota bacterium]
MSKVQAGPFSLEYVDAGSGDRVIVLVHGATSSGRIWHSVQGELAKQGIRSIALSLLGAGGSDRSALEEDYSPKSYAKQLTDAVDALDLETFTLVGHSLGTLVAAYYARDHANRLDALVQMAGPPIISELPKPGSAKIRVRNPEAPDVQARWEGQHLGLPKDVREALRRDIDNNPPERRKGQRPPWKGIDDVAANLNVPTLVIGGDADDIVHPQYPLQYYLSLNEDVRHLHVFHGVGHYLNAQAPERLANVFAQFVKDHALTR